MKQIFCVGFGFYYLGGLKSTSIEYFDLLNRVTTDRTDFTDFFSRILLIMQMFCVGFGFYYLSGLKSTSIE
jgi:hypothetical protein